MNSATPPRLLQVRVAIRVLARALLYFVLGVFAFPCAWSTLTGREISIEIYSWVSWVVWGITFVFASALEELIWRLLTRNRRSDNGR